MTPHKVHFEDGHAVVLSAENETHAKAVAKRHRPGAKITKVEPLLERTHTVHVRELPSADAILTFDALFPGAPRGKPVQQGAA